MPYIHFDHVNKYFGQNHVLKDISLEIEQGELVTFLGPSGCGKSLLVGTGSCDRWKNLFGW